MLHELARRASHTALLIGGPSVQREVLERIDKLIRAQSHASVVIEEIVVIETGAASQCSYAWITPTAAGQLGIREITLFVIRPDLYVALRSDNNVIDDLAAYQRLLVSGCKSTASH